MSHIASKNNHLLRPLQRPCSLVAHGFSRGSATVATHQFAAVPAARFNGLPAHWLQPHVLRLTVALLALLSIALPARAQHDHATPTLPTSYPAALAAVSDGVQSISSSSKSGNLKALGDSAFNLHFLAKSLGKIALDDPSVPRDKIKPINLLGKAIADAAMSIHEAAETGNLPAAMAPFPTLRARADELAKLLGPDPYICEMHCEADKTYDQPGKCPVCHMALTRVSQTPYSVAVDLPKDSPALAAGKPAALDIRLSQPSGKPVGPIDVVHEHPLHLVIVSEDLSFYAHEHPKRTADGVFHLAKFTFPFGGRFTIYADFTPTARPNRVVQTDITVPAGDTPPHTALKLEENEDGIGKDGDYEFRIRCNAGKFIAREDSFFRYGIDLNGKPVTDLQPLMGAMGHLVIISADRSAYIHAHPLEIGGTKDAAHQAGDGHDHDHHASTALLEKARASLLSNGKPSDVVFHTVFPRPGLYRAFAQFQHKGKVLNYAVTIDAKQPDGGTTPSAPAPAHDHQSHQK
jgi:hypothetical protein